MNVFLRPHHPRALVRRAIAQAALHRLGALAAFAALGVIAPAVQAAPPITVTNQTPADGPIKYTVKVTSNVYGNSQETRTIRSGQTDDFTWKSAAGGTPLHASEQCPNYSSLPLDPNDVVLRQMRVRLAPTVAADGTASVQLTVQASAPRGMAAVKVKGKGKSIQCPNVTELSQVVRLTMPTNGKTTAVTLSDGSKLDVSAVR